MDEYELTENYRVTGSTIQASTINTIAECEALCNDNDECDGYDWRDSTNRCYLILIEFDELTANTNFDNYIRVRCPVGECGVCK